MAHAHAPRRGSRLWRFVKRTVLTLFVFACVLAGVLIALLHTRWGRDQIRQQIEAALQSSFPGGAKVGAVDGSVLGELVVSGVELDGLDRKPMITIRELRVHVALLPLVRKRVEVTRLALDGVTVDIHPQPPAPPKPPEPPSEGGSSWSISLDDVRLEHGAFALTGYGAPLHVDDLGFAGALQIPAGQPFAARLAIAGTLRERGLAFALATADATITPVGQTHASELVALAGGALVAAAGVAFDPAKPDRPAGDLVAVAPARAIATLAQLPSPAGLPGDALAIAHVDNGVGRGVRAHALALVGDGRVETWAHGDVAARTASALVIADAPELARFLVHVAGADAAEAEPPVRGPAHAVVMGALSGGWVRGVALADEAFADLPPASAAIAFDATPARAIAHATFAGPGNARAHVIGELRRSKGVLEIATADATIVVPDPALASGGRVPARGALHATATIVDGKLAPALDLRVTGRVDGDRLALADTRVASLDGYYSVRVGASRRPLVSAHLEARGLAQGTAPLGLAVVDAQTRGDDAIDVNLHAYPRPGVAADLDARVIPGDDGTLVVALGRHRVRLPDARELAGAGGTVRVTPAQVVVAKLETEHRGGKVRLGATVDRATGGITGTLDVVRLPVSLVDPRARGDATGHVAITRTPTGGAARWKGDGTIAANNVVIDDKLVVDSRVHVAIDGRRVALEVGTKLAPADTSSAGGLAGLGALHGAAEVALAVDGPADLTDARGWMRLTRKDLRAATVTLGTIDLGLLGASGQVDGTVILTPVDTHGTVQISGIRTPAGAVTGTAVFDNDHGAIAAITEAQVEGVGAAHVEARVGLPEHLFDPAAWQAQGEDAVHGASVTLDRFAVDPALLARFGITAPYTGHARLAVTIGRGIKSAKVAIDADGVAGGPIAKPLDLHAEADMDVARSTAFVDVFTNKGTLAHPLPRPDGERGGQLLHAEASLPVTFDRWRQRGWDDARTAALKGSFTFLPAKVSDLLAIVGRSDVTAGALDGTGTLGGTLHVPTATLAMTAHGVQVPPLITGRRVPTLDELKVAATWGGVAGSLEITGRESDGGRLAITARGRPTALAEATGTLAITAFDIAPLAAFAPGELVTTTGVLSANITIAGFDPERAQMKGDLTLAKGRVPIGALVGTLRDTEAKLQLDGRRGTLSLEGKLGACYGTDNGVRQCRTVKLLAAGDPHAIEATLKLNHIQPVTATQPIISADIAAHLRREGERWTGEVRVANGSVTIPRTAGSELLAQNAPADLVFVDAVAPIVRGPRKAPDRPWLVTDVTIETTTIESDEVRGAVHGELEVSYGAGDLGMVGRIEAEQGVAEVFNHRYQLDRGAVTFDGTTDAQLDLQLVHEFQALTLIANVSNRISDPQLALSSEPGTYTEGQLLGFFLGGEPGGDPNSETRDAATAAGTSLLSQKIGRAANKVLPVKIDVFNCSVASTTTSAACTVGKWLGAKLFVAYKQHLENKPGENQYEGQVEYYLRHDVVLEGNVGDAGYDGLDLLWRHRW